MTTLQTKLRGWMKWEYLAVLLFLAVTMSFVCIQQENIYLTVPVNPLL